MERDLVNKTKTWVRERCFGESSGHDWFHVERVHETAVKIAAAEGADLFTVEMAALLHDVNDPKLVSGRTCSHDPVLNFMAESGLTVLQADRIYDAINEVSFSKNKDKKPTTIEAAVVQDADRLDAIGAVGIARCFAFGGSRDRMIYNPADLVKITASGKTNTDEHTPPSSIAHFYEKLLLVKDLMNTAEGRRLAEDRHAFMEGFLDQFFAEWNGMR